MIRCDYETETEMAEAMISKNFMEASASIPSLPTLLHSNTNGPGPAPEKREDTNTGHGHRHGHGHGHGQHQDRAAIRSPNDPRAQNPQAPISPRRMHKVVEFNVPPQQPPAPKRQRLSAEITAQNVTLAIQHGVTDHIRKEAMYNACAAFDHGVQAAHDDEIRVGADTAIFKHLTFLLLKRNMLEKEVLEHRRYRDLQNDRLSDQQLSEKNVNVNVNLNGSLNVNVSHHLKEHENEHENENKCAHDNENDNENDNKESEIDSLMDEIVNTLQGLEMVLRCSAECISVSFARIGKEILPIILSLLQEQRTLRLKQSASNIHNHENISTSTASSTISVGHTNMNMNACNSHTSNTDRDRKQNSHSSHSHSDPPPPPPRALGDSIFKTATKIIGHFARVGSLTDVLASTKHLLTTLKQIISMPESTSTSTPMNMNMNINTNIAVPIVPIEAKLNCLWIVGNLACSAENMIRMASHPGLIDILVQTASHPTPQDEQECKDITEYLKLVRSRSIAIRAILNLSWAHENKIPLTEHPDLVEILLATAAHRKSPWIGNGKGVSMILLQSRRHSAGALRNLAAAPRRYKRRLCRLNNCTFLERIADIARKDADPTVRDKIHATLYNLVSADTAKLFIEKKAVLDVIVKAATSGTGTGNEADGGGNGNGNGNGSEDCPAARSMAVQTLRSLEKAIPEDEEDYDALRPVLSRFDSEVAMSKSQSTFAMNTVVAAAADHHKRTV